MSRNLTCRLPKFVDLGTLYTGASLFIFSSLHAQVFYLFLHYAPQLFTRPHNLHNLSHNLFVTNLLVLNSVPIFMVLDYFCAHPTCKKVFVQLNL